MSKIAMPIAEGYEDSEFQTPYECLRRAGHDVVVLGLEKGATVHGKKGQSKAEIEATVSDVKPEDFDALVIPGGHAPDTLRLDGSMVEFTRQFAASGRPLAAICHGPQLLIEAEVVKGRTMTSWPSIRKDLINAGAIWVDQPVVEDINLITSRKPDDLNSFCDAILRQLG
ncbi:MAG: type 1 glutamine amidotransferase domain-containing protein [Gammaproteobacteria bacterium]|nr:type 1 glutamine amidotransferase domain-containing protein [Gammaproteobacteria bacterium]